MTPLYTELPFQILCDGCYFGLRNQYGEPLMKQWRIITDYKPLVEPLSHQCPNKSFGRKIHQHGQVRGAAAKLSERYTTKLVNAAAQAIMNWHGREVMPVCQESDDDDLHPCVIEDKQMHACVAPIAEEEEQLPKRRINVPTLSEQEEEEEDKPLS